MVIGLNRDEILKKFPIGFPAAKLPKGIKEEGVEVYRIWRTGKVESASFLPTYLDEVSKTKENEGAEEHETGYYSLYLGKTKWFFQIMFLNNLKNRRLHIKQRLCHGGISGHGHNPVLGNDTIQGMSLLNSILRESRSIPVGLERLFFAKVKLTNPNG